MSDLVKRLHEEGLGFGIGPAMLCQEAAARIVALEAQVAAGKALVDLIADEEVPDWMLDEGRVNEINPGDWRNIRSALAAWKATQ